MSARHEPGGSNGAYDILRGHCRLWARSPAYFPHAWSRTGYCQSEKNFFYVLEPLYTVDDLDSLKGDFELDEGRLVPVTQPKRRHGKVCARLTTRLQIHCDRTGQGEVLSNDTGFILHRDPDTLRGPDIAVLQAERLEGLPEDCHPEMAPDLAIEVVSPANSPGDLQRKVAQYLEAGASLVWVVYPARRTVAVYTGGEGLVQLLGDGQELIGDPVLPGFRCSIVELFG